jgi:uncharacterized protein (DUF1778 family)
MTDKDNLVRVRVSDREKALMQKAADARGLSLSAWVRMIALDAAKKEKAK